MKSESELLAAMLKDGNIFWCLFLAAILTATACWFFPDEALSDERYQGTMLAKAPTSVRVIFVFCCILGFVMIPILFFVK